MGRQMKSRKKFRALRLSFFLTTVAMSSLSPVGADFTTSVLSSAPNERRVYLTDCQVIEKCEMCSFSDQKAVPVCKETGRREKRECVAHDGDDSKSYEDWFSCKYTDADEQFAMVRFQMICVVLGSMALISVRRLKRVTASLFDKRKMAAREESRKAKEKRRSSEYVESHQDEEIEFSRIDQETVPLVDTSSNPLEII